MKAIRYKQRICEDKEKIDKFMKSMRTGTLAMISEGVPYAVPLNYIWLDGAVYFHGLTSGRRQEALSSSPQCCFTVYREYGTVKDDMPCHADTAYFSVILFGKVTLLEDNKEKAFILKQLVEKYMPGYYKTRFTEDFIKNYKSDHDGHAVQVHKLTIDVLTAKRNCADPKFLFAPMS
ncbi:pyridoxamine 5'-phosphate oxidase family protein [Pectinatus cerevisiiphilus]|uniref:Nitroimidazol reductase NimA-like FMN-containing flavoprotein (Pyridoxamine 5'-phosphate oxidase superfamily) n=1 Tax=Pectinatus cerevisiiphilus TaxID=86956 RepID=A0A4R3K6D8_9FIRM|nr:pyridoxamine 5'-phosphate oxidase family protein [Pectinatus cerevisiiphilus]TCS78444.1 hypothetical protein EDC37_11080 [Pectinatus cerevisiiphilus]